MGGGEGRHAPWTIHIGRVNIDKEKVHEAPEINITMAYRKYK